MATKTKVKKTTKKPATIDSSQVMTSHSEHAKTSKQKFSRLVLIIALIVIIGGGLLIYFAKGMFVVASVNGTFISKGEYIKELENQTGKQVLNSLITKQLILQEAKKQNVQVTDADIDAEIKKISGNFSKQGQKLEDVMKAQGVTIQSLRSQIKLQKLVEKMVGKNMTVSDKEISDFMTENSQQIQQQKLTKDQVKQQLLQQKLQTKIPEWIQKLQSEAKITYFQ